MDIGQDHEADVTRFGRRVSRASRFPTWRQRRREQVEYIDDLALGPFRQVNSQGE